MEYSPYIASIYHPRYKFHKNMSDTKRHCDPRAAFHGGRVNNLKFYHKASGDEKICYYDFTSLYPFVLSTKKFPVGHPVVIQPSHPVYDITPYFGFIRCKVLPPKQLYIPVLPFKNDGKLYFPLCRLCCIEKNQDSCDHTDEQRCLEGTFTTVELMKAVEMRYSIEEVYEIYDYKVSCDKLFKEYNKTWLKLKTQSSGFPSDLVTDEMKDQFIIDYKNREGIDLEPSEMEKNPGMRFISKLMLNSLYGKLGQRPNQPITKVVKSFKELYDLNQNSKIEMLGDEQIGNMLLVNYKFVDDKMANAGNTSVAIAAFVTAYARIELYDQLHKIEESLPGSVLYFDTDSIVFVSKPESYSPFLGGFLGQMTDEIEGEFGSAPYPTMTEFFTIGPKTYSYRVRTGVGPNFEFHNKLKAKGITQTIEAKKDCNFYTLKKMALIQGKSLVNDDVGVAQNQFSSNKQHEVSSRKFIKKLRVTSDKRRILKAQMETTSTLGMD